jgi:hypothetical protein
VHGIGGEERTFQIHACEQGFDGRDFIRSGRDQ